MPIPLISKFAKKSKRTEEYVEKIWNEMKNKLLLQGLEEDDKRFYPYLVNMVKKKLEINESSLIIKRFKDFLKEQNETKGL